jgi:hypothetical protein
VEVQTRNEEGACIMHASLKEAFEAAKCDKTIWKISWTIQETGERVRLIKAYLHEWNDHFWMYDPIDIPEPN